MSCRLRHSTQHLVAFGPDQAIDVRQYAFFPHGAVSVSFIVEAGAVLDPPVDLGKLDLDEPFSGRGSQPGGKAQPLGAQVDLARAGVELPGRRLRFPLAVRLLESVFVLRSVEI